MAEVNIDKALIDQTALLQSDEVVAMQNGCVCCTLKCPGQTSVIYRSRNFPDLPISAM